MKCIIPASGFGTRMQMKPDQSKELLPIPGYPDKPLISYSLDLCKEYDLEPVVITRSEKRDLIKYLLDKNVELVVQKPGKEWAETVLNAKDHWGEKNILMLPDTQFKPTNIIHQIKQSLIFGCDVVFAVHGVEDVSKWGEVNKRSFAEKPSHYFETPGYAWGLIGFSKYGGEWVFSNMKVKNVYSGHTDNTNFLFLDEFTDLTRK